MAENKKRIKEIKSLIQDAQTALVNLIQNKPSEENQTEEEKKVNQESFSNEFAKIKATTQGLTKELELVRMNKNMSSAFEWHPTGPNRRMRKEKIKQNRLVRNVRKA